MVDLDELARLEQAATPGPWDVGGWSDQLITNRDRMLICASRTALPALLARARAGERLAGLLQEHEWHPFPDLNGDPIPDMAYCPQCQRERPGGHAPGCELAAALAAWRAAKEGR